MFERANILVVTFRFFFLKSNASTQKIRVKRLKDNCPFNSYKISEKYLQVQFLKT